MERSYGLGLVSLFTYRVLFDHWYFMQTLSPLGYHELAYEAVARHITDLDAHASMSYVHTFVLINKST